MTLEVELTTSTAPSAGNLGAPATAAPGTADASGLGTQKLAALVVGGVGIIGLGIGSLIGLSANAEYKNAHCTGNVCPQPGFDDRQSAISRAKTASIVFGAGAAAVVGGVALWLTAPSSRTVVTAQPMIGKSSASLAIGGAW